MSHNQELPHGKRMKVSAVHLDDKRRLVIPLDLCKSMGIKTGEPFVALYDPDIDVVILASAEKWRGIMSTERFV